ncbi:MAG: hypothetical protein ACRDE5_16530 [Ginsengibacter sp.]
MTDKKNSNQSFLRTTALIVALAGAAGSLYFMFSASRKQNSIILLGLFTVWVLSPFVGLFISNKISNRWTVTAHRLFYWLIIILTIGSLVAYSGAFNTPETKNAFIFLIVPLISWILLIVTVLTARRLSRKINVN